MRTKEPKQHKPDFAEISRRSIKKDFQKASFQIQKQVSIPQEQSNIKRVLAISETSSYIQYKRFFIGKLVRILREAISGGFWVEFVNEDDRKLLNANAGWNNKHEYLLDGVKFDK